MRNLSGSTANAVLTGRHFLIADLKTGSALLQAAQDSHGHGRRAYAVRQIEEAVNAVQKARDLLTRANEREVLEFAARVEELGRAIEAAGRVIKPGARSASVD